MQEQLNTEEIAGWRSPVSHPHTLCRWEHKIHFKLSHDKTPSSYSDIRACAGKLLFSMLCSVYVWGQLGELGSLIKPLRWIEHAICKCLGSKLLSVFRPQTSHFLYVLRQTNCKIIFFQHRSFLWGVQNNILKVLRNPSWGNMFNSHQSEMCANNAWQKYTSKM